MLKIKFERITNPKDFKKIEALIKDYRFKPYYSLKQLKDIEIGRLFEWQLSKIISGKSNLILAAKVKNSYRGFAILEKQPWDSSFFGFNCYKMEHISACGESKFRIDVKSELLGFISGLCKEENIRYLNVKVDTQDNTSIYAFESYGFKLVSAMLHLVYITKQRRRHFKIVGKIRPYREKDLKTLRMIARNSMHYDHFHSDFHFPREVSDNIYASLIDNCCKGVLSDKVFVVERKGKVVGYVACQIRHDLNSILPLRIGHIRHLAVLNPEGFGCGPGLQEAALNWFKDKVDMVESTTTIQNTPIIRISIKSNMDIVSSHLRFSKWFEG